MQHGIAHVQAQGQPPASQFYWAGQDLTRACCAVRRRVTRAQSQTGTRPVSYVELHTGAPLVSAIDIAEPVVAAASAEQRSEADEDAQPKKKKVGRPIAYKGDINSPHLTEAERRRIKRRVANRESARRVRQKRQETMEELQIRMGKVKEENAALANYLTEVQGQKQELQAQLARLQGEWAAANSNNLRLMEEVSTKRNSLQAMTCPSVATLSTSSMDQDGIVAAARSAATAVTSGIRNSICTLSTGGTGFRPGAVVTTSGTHYAGNVTGGAVVTGLGHASFPAVQVQGTHAPGGSPTVGVKTEPVNRGMRPAPGAAPSAGMLVPDICRAPTACAFNIVGPFSQGPGAKPPCSGPASSSAVDGFMVPSLQGPPCDTNDFLFRYPSNKDPLDMLLLSEQSLDQLAGGF
jgi:FtsZ-binding cell division protein ZapB